MISALRNLVPLSRVGQIFLPSSARLIATSVVTESSANGQAVDINQRKSDAGKDTNLALNNKQEPERDVLYQRLEIEVRGHDPAVLKSYEWYACKAADHLGIILSNKWIPPKQVERWDTLKSVFIYKKHLVQYEARTYFRVMEFKHLTGSTADTYLEYIQRNLPEGVSMIVTKHELQKIPSHIRPPTSTFGT